MEGDGVRHNRSEEIFGTDDSWLPGGARSFLFRGKAATILTVNPGVFICASAGGGSEQTCA
jgi:hypothetical protein